MPETCLLLLLRLCLVLSLLRFGFRHCFLFWHVDCLMCSRTLATFRTFAMATPDIPASIYAVLKKIQTAADRANRSKAVYRYNSSPTPMTVCFEAQAGRSQQDEAGRACQSCLRRWIESVRGELCPGNSYSYSQSSSQFLHAAGNSGEGPSAPRRHRMAFHWTSTVEQGRKAYW